MFYTEVMARMQRTERSDQGKALIPSGCPCGSLRAKQQPGTREHRFAVTPNPSSYLW